MISAFSTFCIRQRKPVVVILTLITVFFAYFAVQTDVVTKFEDQQPSSHPYIQVHQKFKDTFGGSNIVTFMVKSKNGDIFQPAVLKKIQELTFGLLKIDAVNEFQIISLAGKKLKEVKASTEGIESKPYMWPNLPKNQEEINYLKDAVLRNPLVYGPVVSHDLKSTLITVDFFDNLIDYNKAFAQINALVAKVDGGPVEVSVVGNPVLYGWVNHYLPETVKLAMVTVAFFLVALFLINRTWRGTFLPLVAAIMSATWALGICKLLNINFDPLLMVIAMLITARAVSHSVQMLTRFHEEVENIEDHHETSAIAARITLRDILRPGLLGIVTDAGCLAVVALSPIPLLQKLTVLAVVWVLTLIISAVILTPVLLSWVKHPRGYVHKLDIDTYVLRPVLNTCVMLVTSRARYAVVGVAAVVFVICGYNALQLKVGDANPGSPILWPNAKYNQNSAAINSAFPGSDRMFVVVGGGKTNGIKDVNALMTMQKFQRYMEAQPEIGGTLSIADILPAVNRTLREDNIRYQELGADALQNGELMYMFEQAAEPGDLDRYVDNDRANGSVTLFFSDHQGKTIRTAIARIKQFMAENNLPANAQIHLAGGYVGVLAAVNEVILSGQIESIALALLVMMLLCIAVYRSSIAGLFFMLPVVLSNIVTFAFMAWQNIGMNINTVPVAALGIGLGVDYALYICDRIKHEYEHGATATEAVTKAIHTSGRGVLVTAVVLVLSVLLWLSSSLRFQAEMGLLVALWLAVSATSAIILMPTLALMFKPSFIFGSRVTEPVLTAEEEASLATA